MEAAATRHRPLWTGRAFVGVGTPNHTGAVTRRRSGWPAKGRHSPRKGANRLPEKQRQRILRQYPVCQLGIAGVCTGRSVEVHHHVDAADGGADTDYLPDGTPQLLGVCRECHRYVSARRSAAKGGVDGRRVFREPERLPGILP